MSAEQQEGADGSGSNPTESERSVAQVVRARA